MRLTYSDVYEWHSHHPSNLCWLRRFDADDSARAVVVLTDVPLNPGDSVVNDIESLAQQVARYEPNPAAFEWYIAYLADFLSEETNFHKVDFEGSFSDPSFERATRAEIEAVTGHSLGDFPPPEEFEARLLASGGRIEEPHVERFLMIPVAELPFPHGPSRCAHSARFEKLAEQANAKKIAQLVEVGREFIESLTSIDFAQCEYHEWDWAAIAAASVRIVEALGASPEPDALERAIVATDLPDRERLQVFYLFKDPIVVGPGGFTNGQHRSCAIRASGADRVVVVGRD